jgi:hypothetical protein
MLFIIATGGVETIVKVGRRRRHSALVNRRFVSIPLYPMGV